MTFDLLPRTIAGVHLPDSRLAQEAYELVREVSPACVLNHTLRSYVFGALVADQQRMRYDQELFFLAAIMHDLGLTETYRGEERFEVVGADAAVAFLDRRGVSVEKQSLVWDAIALHTSIGIASRKEAEVALVHIGAGVDVLGLHLDEMPSELIARTLEILPRHDFKTSFWKVLTQTVIQSPRAAPVTWLAEIVRQEASDCKCPSFQELMSEAAFDE